MIERGFVKNEDVRQGRKNVVDNEAEDPAVLRLACDLVTVMTDGPTK